MDAALADAEKAIGEEKQGEADRVAALLLARARVDAEEESPLPEDDDGVGEEEALGEEAFRKLSPLQQARIEARDRQRKHRQRLKEEAEAVDYKSMEPKEYEALYKKVRGWR
jgi:hypothetical protein